MNFSTVCTRRCKPVSSEEETGLQRLVQTHQLFSLSPSRRMLVKVVGTLCCVVLLTLRDILVGRSLFGVEIKIKAFREGISWVQQKRVILYDLLVSEMRFMPEKLPMKNQARFFLVGSMV